MILLTSLYSGVKKVISTVDGWFAKILPGVKTYIATGIGALGTIAYMAKDYIASPDVAQFITAQHLAWANVILFTIAFWTHNMTARNAVVNP